VFYDLDRTSEMCGEDLVVFLQDVYRRRARFAILFVSRHYLERKWTNHERRSVPDRALPQGSPYLLPVRLDDTDLPGLHSTTGYLDARTIGIDGIVEAVMQKLGQTRTETLPHGWEYLLYAAVIKQGVEDLYVRYQDHLLEYAPRNDRFAQLEDALPSGRLGFDPAVSEQHDHALEELAGELRS
jgi:hypothetical protein